MTNLPLDVARRIHQQCERFELAWQGPQRPRLQNYLVDVLDTERSFLLAELLALELELRCEAEEQPTEDEYRSLLCGNGDGDVIERVFRQYHLNAFQPGPVTISNLDNVGIVKADRRITPTPKIEGYEILKVLGRGGMGVVYKARDLRLKRLVALKMILAGDHASPQLLARFRTEAELVARLQHPNIVQIFDVGEQDGHPFIAFEYIEGKTLADLVNREPQPFRLAAELMEAMALAIHYAHQLGIIHRDLKPANILLASQSLPLPTGSSSDPRDASSCSGSGVSGRNATASGLMPKITDFGLAKDLENAGDFSSTGAILGTPNYMSPEQAAGRGRAVGPASDVYSLGAILYVLLTGRPPFQGTTPIETLSLVMHAEPVAPTQFQPRLPRDLETICLKCLEKEPARRYASAGELAEDLCFFLNGLTIRARPVSRVERTVKWVKRNPGLASALAVVAIVLIGVTVASLVVADQFRAMANKQTDLADKEKASRLAAEQARDGGRRELYHAETTLAVRLLGMPGSIERVKAHVDRWTAKPDAADLFGWEWRLTQNLTQPIAKSRAIPRGAMAVEFSPDGRTLAVGDQGLILFDPDTWRVRKEWDCVSSINSLQWEPSGHRIAISSRDRVTMFDTQTETPLWQRPAHLNPQMVWGPLCQCVAFCDSHHRCRIADARTGKTLQTLDGVDNALAFSPDGKRFAAALITPTGAHDIRIWRTSGWTIEKNITFGTDAVRAMTWSPDGKQLAISTAIGEVILFNPASGNRTQSLEANGKACNTLAWRADGRWLAARQHDQTIRVWECATWVEVPLVRNTTSFAHTIRWRPHGTALFAGCGDRHARLWNIDERQAYWTFHFGTRLANTSYLSCAWHPDSRSLVGSGASPGSIVWGVDGSRQHQVNGVEWQWTSDGKYSASVLGEHITVWDAAGQSLAKVELPGQPKILAWQPKSHTLAIRTASRVYLWKPITGEPPVLLFGEPTPMGIDHIEGNRMAWSPDGTQLAFGEKTANREAPWQICIMNVANRTIIKTLAEGNMPVLALAWSPDGQRIGIGRDEPSARVYDVVSGRQIQELAGHGAAVWSIAWHPSGTRLATGSADGSAKVWDSERGRPTVTFEIGTVVRCMTWSPDGTALAAAAEAGTIHVWNSQAAPR